MDQDPWRHLAMTAITLAGVAAVMWMEAPPWQREMITRAARCRMRWLATRLAARSGHRAMGDELAGRMTEAEIGYGFTYRLSVMRDRLAG